MSLVGLPARDIFLMNSAISHSERGDWPLIYTVYVQAAILVFGFIYPLLGFSSPNSHHVRT